MVCGLLPILLVTWIRRMYDKVNTHRRAGQGKEKGRKRSSAPEKIDAFDSLVAEYKASLFGKEGRKKPLSSKEPTKRWFE